jgi:formate hydrogenlyase subunit 3/multisubunit Na+/H+ antiporter MnhD subunit
VSALLVIALACLLLAVVVALAGAARPGAVAMLAAGCLLAIVGLVACLGGPGASLDLGTWLGFGESALHVDRLSGLFLGLTGVTTTGVALTYIEHAPSRAVVALVSLLLGAMALVICSDNGFVFLIGWESLTLVLYLLAGWERARPGVLVAGYFTGAMNKLGGAALLAAFALLYAKTGSFGLADWAQAAPQLSAGTRAAVFLLLLVGFGTKVALVPFQGWLPVGHAAAPGAASATLSGIAVNAGFYGLWRLVFEGLRPLPLWYGDTVLVLGALTALLGIVYAIAQSDIKRFLGCSTIEHSGITLIGFAVALIGEAAGEPSLAAAGLVAATLHLIAHALAKTLAFLSADRVVRATGTRELEPLGGLGLALPRTAGAFGVAVFTLAALPPLGGFVSEWLTFEALLQAFRVPTTTTRLLMALAAALLALTVGLALLAFAKLWGFLFLGHSRGRETPATEPPGMGIGLALLAVVTLALGPLAPWVLRLIGSGLLDVLGFQAGDRAVTHPLVLGPVYHDFSVLAPTWLAIVLPAYAVLLALLTRALLRPAVRRAPVWVSGSAADLAQVQYRPGAYVNPIRVVLRGAYGFRRELSTEPGARHPANAGRRLDTRVVPLIEEHVYRPLTAGALALSARVRALQSGRLGTYLIYMLAALIVALALIPTFKN